ncbi:ATP-dependent nuclease [Tellurirhabdus rosea]|uniref:ATP-dependent nuclease n=1 Tax=Tellurirhabdus rosea TaxID=2674997 RepID=UPI002252484A|nr:AAA family ATPase [Tellurirhabdus rosea]
MFLSRLLIQNFRSIENLDIKLQKGRNVIVGRNNAGKSNIVKAIDLLLGEYSPTYNRSENITESDFFCGDKSKRIFIWCEITRETNELGQLENIDFSEVKNTAFYNVSKKDTSELANVNTNTFTESTINKLFYFCSEEGQTKIDNNEFKKRWIGGKSYCKGTYESEFLNSQFFAIAFIGFYSEEGKLNRELVFLYKEKKEDNWILAFNCSLRTTLIQSAIIPAFRDPKDQLRITSYSWYGKLLKAYISPNNSQLESAFEIVKNASKNVFQNLESQIVNKSIDVAFPNTSISFLLNPDSKQDVYKNALIYVNDGFSSELKDKGAGIQSAVLIGLFDFYIRNVAHSGNSLLAIEEPELYLHPHGRRVISDRLNSFIGDGSNQVILTTHSPEFITSVYDNQNIISVKKAGVSTVGTNIYFNDSKKKQILVKKQNAEMFFADAVILTEGAEKYFIEEAAKEIGSNTTIVNTDGSEIILGRNWLNNYNVSIINTGGKGELYKYKAILDELGIANITTSDFDFLRDGLNEFFKNLQFNQTYHNSLNAIKSKIISIYGSGKYKSISQLANDPLIEEVKKFILELRAANIFIFSGELEDFYTVAPFSKKEAGVIETIGKIISTGNPLSSYLNIEEYTEMLSMFLKKILKINIK